MADMVPTTYHQQMSNIAFLSKFFSLSSPFLSRFTFAEFPWAPVNRPSVLQLSENIIQAYYDDVLYLAWTLDFRGTEKTSRN